MTKRIVSLVLALLMILSTMAISSAETTTDSWLTDTSPVTLKMYYDRPVDGAEVSDANGTEPVSTKWTEETGVTIDFSYAVDDSHSKLNMLIAAGDYPDILICQSSYDMLQDLVDNGILVAFNKVEDDYAPGFVERNMSDNTILSVREDFSTMDVYALPVYSYKVEDMSRDDIASCMTGMMVLKSVYEAIGSPDMTTIDGFLDALRKVKEMYPDMIPFQASRNSSKDSDGNPRCIGKLLGFFDLCGGYYYDDASDTYLKYWHSDNYYKLIEFVNTLYNEGLMDPTELTDSGEQLQAKLFGGKVFCNMCNDADNIDWFNTELASAGIDDEWIFPAQMSVNTEEGYTYDNINGGVGDHYIVVFNTENSERAVQWLDFIMQEQQQLEIVLGVQGLSWDYNEEGIPTNYDNITAMTDNEKKTEYGVGLWYFLREGLINNILSKNSGSAEQTAAIEFMNQYYKDYSFFSGSKPQNYDADSEEIKIYTNIKEYYEPEILQLIMCEPDELQSMFDEMMAKLYDLGQATLDTSIDNYFKSKAAQAEEYGADLDLSFMGLE